MESKFSGFDIAASDTRIKEILESAETFDEVDSIPSRDSLTYSNGFYVNCTAVFIDIRGSARLTDSHTRPVIGKIYRAYISECVSVMNADENCKEVFITGDCVSGIFNSPYTYQIVGAFETAGKLSSLIELLNWNLQKKGYKTIECGIGIAYGRALMIQAGAKGSGVKDVVWIGDVVNEAAHLCHEGNRDGRMPVQLSKSIYENLTENYQKFCRSVGMPWPYEPDNYETDIYNISMKEYIGDIKKKSAQESLSFLNFLAQNPYPTGQSLSSLMELGMIPPKFK